MTSRCVWHHTQKGAGRLADDAVTLDRAVLLKELPELAICHIWTHLQTADVSQAVTTARCTASGTPKRAQALLRMIW